MGDAGPRRAPPEAPFAVETVRGLAIVLLVAYHVIGSGPGSGLRLEHGTFLRFCADLLVDVRMPLFACIAGYIYANRPPKLAGLGRFVAGKLRRLALPGATAALLFAVVATVLENRFAVSPSQLWRPLVLPFAHYWFLQAILVIFLLYGSLDAVLRHRGTPLLLGLAAVVFWSDWHPPTRIMSMGHALYLLPFFLLGVLLRRHPPDGRARWILAGLALGVGLGGLAANGFDLLASGTGGTRRDLQSLVTGCAICGAALLAAPRSQRLARLGPYGLTIYLYHVFATAGLRTAMAAMGLVPWTWAALAAGLAAGIGLPVLLHRAAARTRIGRILVLGRWPELPTVGGAGRHIS